MPLTPEQRVAIREAWARVRPHVEEHPAVESTMLLEPERAGSTITVLIVADPDRKDGLHILEMGCRIAEETRTWVTRCQHPYAGINGGIRDPAWVWRLDWGA